MLTARSLNMADIAGVSRERDTRSVPVIVAVYCRWCRSLTLSAHIIGVL